MDPNACWERLRDAIGDKDWETVKEASAELSGWIRLGGFIPRGLVGKGYVSSSALHMLKWLNTMAAAVVDAHKHEETYATRLRQALRDVMDIDPDELSGERWNTLMERVAILLNEEGN